MQGLARDLILYIFYLQFEKPSKDLIVYVFLNLHKSRLNGPKLVGSNKMPLTYPIIKLG